MEAYLFETQYFQLTVGSDAHKLEGCHLMTADAEETILLEGTAAALITAPTEKLMDCIDPLEADFGLPRYSPGGSYPAPHQSQVFRSAGSSAQMVGCLVNELADALPEGTAEKSESGSSSADR